MEGPPSDRLSLKRLYELLIADAEAKFQHDLRAELQRPQDKFLKPIDPEDPRWALMVEVATALVKAGFRIDDCMVGGHVGGVCLQPTPEGLMVSWSQHDLSGYQFYRADYREVELIMGKAVAEVLTVLGFRITATVYPSNFLVSRGKTEGSVRPPAG